MAQKASGEGALQGAATGAALGTVGGPMGMAIGAGIGGLAGAFALGQRGKSDRTQEMIDMRRAQIQQFGLQLAQAREKLRSRTMALQAETFKRFVPELEAQFASRGKTVTGGAFQSELAKATSLQQKELELQDSLQERTDLGAVQELETGAANLGIAAEQSRFANELARAREQQNALGQLTGLALPGAFEAGSAGLANILSKFKNRPGVVTGQGGVTNRRTLEAQR